MRMFFRVFSCLKKHPKLIHSARISVGCKGFRERRVLFSHNPTNINDGLHGFLHGLNRHEFMAAVEV